MIAAEILALAAFRDGKYGQGFPSFGSERKGAPVTAFCRIGSQEIRSREPVVQPNVVIIQDPTLLNRSDLFTGLDASGFILINSTKTFQELGVSSLIGEFSAGHVCTVPASEIALEHLGRPLPNAVLLGGFAALTGALTLESVKAAIRERFPGSVGEKNSAAAQAAFDYVISHATAQAA